MTGTAWLTSLVICGVVWGGFLFLLSRASGHQGGKPDDEKSTDGDR